MKSSFIHLAKPHTDHVTTPRTMCINCVVHNFLAEFSFQKIQINVFSVAAELPSAASISTNCLLAFSYMKNY